MKYRPFAALLAPAALGSLLAACSASTQVSLTGYTPITPTQYSHVWVTVSDVWFNESGTAGPDEAGWRKFKLSTPSTVDLVAQNNGNLGELASGLNIEPGTYSQVRLIPVDATAPLADSASAAGALYNSEADYVDGSGTTHQLPLELLNPDKGIGIPTSIKVPVPGFSKSALAGTGTTGTTATGTAVIGGTGTTTGTTGTTGTGVGGTSSTSETPNFYTTTIDGTTDLVAFTATNTPAILLSQHAAAYDLAVAGAISGTLTLTNITSGTSGLPAIQVNAETLSDDGTRHVVVATTSVQSDGTFTLYPLTTNTSTTNPLTYDVVIHGPGIATIIVKSVQVPRPTTSAVPATTTTTTPTTGTTGTGTTGSTTTTTSASSTAPTVTPVSIGTLTPRAAASTPATSIYTATVSTAAGSPLPSGATVGFYQTIARAGEVPYLIERAALDPFNQVLFTPQPLSVGTIDAGTWSTTGGAVTVVSAAPREGTGKYAVAAFAPGYNSGSLGTVVSPPPAGTTTPQNVPLAGLTLASGTSAGSVAATVTLSSPGKYDSGELLLSNNGTLVASTPLNAVLKQGGGTVNLTNVPAGTPSALYYVTVRAWNSGDPDPTQALRQFYPTAVDLRGSTGSSIPLTIN